MGDSTLDSELLVLIDKWPGTARPTELEDLPTGGILGSTHHNVATPAFAPGEKLAVWNDLGNAGQPGQSVFIYLQYEGTGAPTMVAKQLVVPAHATNPFVVTNDPDWALAFETGSFLSAVALSAVTDGRWGWYWCGGICPESFVAALAGNFATEGNVAAGNVIAHNLAADAIGLGPSAADTEVPIGYALAADA